MIKRIILETKGTFAFAWVFDCSRDAYDFTQACEDAADGDLMLIKNDKELIIGVVDTWPMALTKQAGKLHEQFEGELLDYLKANKLDRNLGAARDLASLFGAELREEIA